MLSNSFHFIALVTIFAVTNKEVSSNFEFGSCLPGKNSCSECYLTLKESLLKRDDNIFSLSNVFNPPKGNIQPEFVNVTYTFTNSSQGMEIDQTTEVWYWTSSSSHLLFPLNTFQFLSLFFGKAENFSSTSITLKLDAECFEADKAHFRLLTQRLKIFIQRKQLNPVIDDDYFARAEQNLDSFISGSTDEYIISFYIVASILFIIIMVMLLLICLYSRRWESNLKRIASPKPANKKAQAIVFGVATTSFVFNFYSLILDAIAVHEHVNKSKNGLTFNEVQPKLHLLPIVALSLNLLAMIICGIFWVLSQCISWIINECTHTHKCKEMEYIFLAVSTTGPILSLVIHLPYIAIAFLNDAYYATSIFIYYTLVFFVLFGALEISYNAFRGIFYSIRLKSLTVSEITLNQNLKLTNTTLNPNQSVTINADSEIQLKVNEANVRIEFGKVTFIDGNPIANADNPRRITNITILSNEQAVIQFLTDTLPGHTLNIQSVDGQNVNRLRAKVETKADNDEYTTSLIMELILQTGLTVSTSSSETRMITFTDNNDNALTINNVNLQYQPPYCCSCCYKSGAIYSTFAIIIPAFAVLLLVLIGMVTALFIVIPINRSISDAPNRLLGFYQSAIVIGGAFLIYKNFFKKKPSLESAIAKRSKHIAQNGDADTKWEQMSKEERVDEFYKQVVDKISRYTPGPR